MKNGRRIFQRIALATIAVCLIALLGPRLVQADREHIVLDFTGPYRHSDDNAPKGPHAQSSARGEVFLDESFVVEAGDRLAIELASTDLIIETASNSSRARVVIQGEGRDAAEEFERRRFSVDYSARTIDVHSDPEEQDYSGYGRANFTVTVTVPSRMNTDIVLASGDVTIGDLVGYFDLTTASGDVDVSTAQGPSISMQVASGDIEVASLDGAVSVSSASGDIRIDQIRGASVDLNSASGDIYVETVQTDRIEASSASGDIEIEHLIGQANMSSTSGDISLHLADAANISTTSGSVTLRLPRGAGFDVNLQGSDVEIDGSLNFNGSRGEREARGTIGSGGPRLEVSTTSGSIELDVE